MAKKTAEELEAEIAELRKTNAELADQLQRKEELKASALNQPRVAPDLDAEGYSNREYNYRREPGIVMRLKIDKDDPRGYTHKLKSAERFWEGSEKEFRDEFDPVDPSEARKKKKAAESESGAES